MREIYAETGILATREEVWKILADFDRYPEWNPFIRRIEGEQREGARLEVEIEAPGVGRMLFRPTVVTVEPGRELRWIGELWRPGFFDGEHSFTIEPVGTGRVHLIQRELFSGLLAPVLMPLLEKRTRQGFEEMNYALKKRAGHSPCARTGAAVRVERTRRETPDPVGMLGKDPCRAIP